MLDPHKANATHNMAAYRLQATPTPSDIQESYQDDGEIGGGRHLRYLLQRRNAVNVVAFVTRLYQGTRLGAKRWELMEQALCSAFDDLAKHRHQD